MSFLIEKTAYNASLSNKQYETKQHFGCVIYNKKKLIATGYNFHSFGTTQTCCCHAEMNAIYKHLKQLNLWKQFQSLLRVAYLSEPVFHRLKGKAS